MRVYARVRIRTCARLCSTVPNLCACACVYVSICTFLCDGGAGVGGGVRGGGGWACLLARIEGGGNGINTTVCGAVADHFDILMMGG